MGTACTIIFLHNGFDSALTWQDVVHYCALQEPAWQLVSFNRQGYGHGAYSPEDFANLAGRDLVQEGAAELETIYRSHGITQAILVGHCMGGAIALAFAQAHPQQVAGLVLESTGLFSTQALREKAAWLLESWELMGSQTQNTLEFMHGKHKARQLWQHVADYKGSYFMHEAYDMRPVLAGLQCPVFCILGERDPYFSPQHLQDGLQRSPQSSFEIWPETGHDPHREQAERFARFVLNFAHSCLKLGNA